MTTTHTGSWSIANVRRVMEKVHEDLLGDVNAGLCSEAFAQTIYRDLSKLLELRAIKLFQFQYKEPGGRQSGFQYQVSDDGSVTSSDRSGGRNLLRFPRGTKLNLVVDSIGGPNSAEALEYLKEQGWGFDGRLLDGRAGRSRVYAHNGYALTRTEVGD